MIILFSSHSKVHHLMRDRCATIIVHSDEHHIHSWRRPGVTNPRVDELGTSILESISLMPNLDSLTLDVEFLSDRKTARLAAGLKLAKMWEIRQLRIAVRPLLSSLVIENCCPNTLKHLQIYQGTGCQEYVPNQGTGSREYVAAAKHCKRLEGLQIFIDSKPEWHPSVDKIAANFEHLEWLVLYDFGENRKTIIYDEMRLVSIFVSQVLRLMAQHVSRNFFLHSRVRFIIEMNVN